MNRGLPMNRLALAVIAYLAFEVVFGGLIWRYLTIPALHTLTAALSGIRQ
jgi:hypothetical protein